MFFKLLTGVWFEPRKDVFDLLGALDAEWIELLPPLLEDNPNARPTNLIVHCDEIKKRAEFYRQTPQVKLVKDVDGKIDDVDSKNWQVNISRFLWSTGLALIVFSLCLIVFTCESILAHWVTEKRKVDKVNEKINEDSKRLEHWWARYVADRKKQSAARIRADHIHREETEKMIGILNEGGFKVDKQEFSIQNKPTQNTREIQELLDTLDGIGRDDCR